MWSIHLSASQEKEEDDCLLGRPKSSLFAFGLAQVLHNSRKNCLLKHLKYRASGQFWLKATAFVICPKQEPNPYFLS